MKHIMKYIIYLLLLTGLATSCTNDDYLTDGGIHDPNVNMTTYDYLKSKPLFDTLIMAIDIAGLKDEINAAGTFYAPTNFAINTYISDELKALRESGDSEAIYTFDSIPVSEFGLIRMYIFEETLTRENLIKDGEVYASTFGTEFKLSKEPEDTYQSDLVINPEYLYFINKKGDEFDTYTMTHDGSFISEKEKDERILVQTSGIISTTGVIHVLENKHTFLFHEVK